jgi:hypothetical protein
MVGVVSRVKSLQPKDQGDGYAPLAQDQQQRFRSLDEREYEDGTEPQLLDVIQIPMIGSSGHGHQTENQTIDSRYYWQKCGNKQFQDLPGLSDSPTTLWINGSSTHHGIDDHILATQVSGLTTSLYLIHPDDLTIRVFVLGIAFGNLKRAVRANFSYKGCSYDFKVTDIDLTKKLLAGSNRSYLVSGNAYLCVSLAEAHTDGYCYKLIASVFLSEEIDVS